MAIEDACVLAKCLAAGRDADALRRYERQRLDRTRRVVETAERFGRLFQWENAAARAARPRRAPHPRVADGGEPALALRVRHLIKTRAPSEACRAASGKIALTKGGSAFKVLTPRRCGVAVRARRPSYGLKPSAALRSRNADAAAVLA